jgi:hypothetical protein
MQTANLYRRLDSALQHGPYVAEVLVEYPETVRSDDGRIYMARACGSELPDRLWQGWIEFIPVDGGEPVRSPRETTQPNHADIHYWATGLGSVYLEGALHRALNPPGRRAAHVPPPPLFDGPADPPDFGTGPAVSEAILNPFSIYQKGETLLQRQLLALSPWHLVNIVRAHDIDTQGRDPERMSSADLINAIIEEVRARPVQ